MAGGGIGEAALISAAIGGTTAAATGGDPFRGAMMGALTGGLTSGIGGLLSPETATLANEASQAGSVMGGGVNPPPTIPTTSPTLGSGMYSLANSPIPDASSLSVASNFNAPIGADVSSALSYTPPAPTTSMTAGFTPEYPTFGDRVSNFLNSGKNLGIGTLAMTGGGAGLSEAMRAERERYKVPAAEHYEGPLSRFRYDPSTYTPFTYRPYAGGGSVEAMSNANAVGANTGFPMADIQRGAYATPYQQPISQNVVTGASDTRVDPYTGEERLASGGIASLGGYSDGGRLLRGPGDGVSDSIPATISGREPARLADGEFVVPARIVSELGNGSTDAGARQLYKMMDRVQSARSKTVGKDKVARNTRASRYLPA